MSLTIEIEQEDDGRWITEVPELPGVLAYGQTRDEAVARAKALALRALADRLELGEAVPEMREVFSEKQDSSPGRSRRLMSFGQFAGPCMSTEEDFRIAEWRGDAMNGDY